MPQLDERLRAIVESALEHTVNGVVITDARQPHNPIVHVNTGFCRITGYSPEDVLGLNCSFLQGDDRNQVGVQTMRDAIANRQSCMVELRNYRKDGEMFWNQVELSPVTDPNTGEVSHFFALQTNVTLRRKAEDAALMHALELERIFSSAPVGMLTFDALDRVHLVSPAFISMFKVSSKDLIGQPRSHLPSILRKALGHSEESLPWNWPTANQAVRWSLPGGSHQAVEVSLSQLDEISRECVVLFRDVSEELAHVVSRSQFLATAAHELRTPMGSIKGFTELLLMRDFNHEEARPLLETILNQSMRLSTMLNDLLDLSRVDALGAQAFTVKPMAMMPAIQRAVQLVSAPGAKRTIRLQVPTSVPRVHGHAGKLEQVVINLLSNAIKYSPADSPVSLTVEADPDGSRWHIHVSDEGIGLPEADQAKLFTRFFRANPNGPVQGTGLGLVIAKELIERMGGEVTLRSTPGQGSTFTVTLLACADVPAPSPPGHTPPPTIPQTVETRGQT